MIVFSSFGWWKKTPTEACYFFETPAMAEENTNRGVFIYLEHLPRRKIENHCHAISLYFVYYNFCKIHTSLSITPAMQAGLTKKPMSIEDIANLAPIEVPKKRGAYKKKEIL